MPAKRKILFIKCNISQKIEVIKKNGSQEIAIQYQTIKTAINIEKYLSN
jgi:hypothetical protein